MAEFERPAPDCTAFKVGAPCAVRAGENHLVEDWEKINRTIIHLREHEWSSVNRLLTDTCQKLDGLESPGGAVRTWA